MRPGAEYVLHLVSASYSIPWRRFGRIPLDGRVPHPTTLMKLTTRCGAAAVDGLKRSPCRGPQHGSTAPRLCRGARSPSKSWPRCGTDQLSGPRPCAAMGPGQRTRPGGIGQISAGRIRISTGAWQPARRRRRVRSTDFLGKWGRSPARINRWSEECRTAGCALPTCGCHHAA